MNQATSPHSWHFVAGLLAVIVGQAAIRLAPASVGATIFFLASSAGLAWSLSRAGARAPAEDVPRADPVPEVLPPRRLATYLAVLALSGLVTATYLLSAHWTSLFYPGWALLTAATALASIALWLRDGRSRPRQRWQPRELVLLLLILTLGTWLRAHRLGDFPDGYTTHAIEEQQTGLGGYRVLHQDSRPWEFFIDYQMTAAALALDPTPNFTTIRVPYVVISALTILPVHLLLRQLFPLAAALAGTFLYAAMSWNLLYARCAHPIFPTNLTVIAVLAMLVHFGRTRRFAVLPWIGLLCGTTLYSYAGYRGTPLFAFVFLAGLLLIAFVRPSGRRDDPASGTDRRSVQRCAAALLLFLTFLLATAVPLRSLLQHAPGNYYFEAADRALANKEYYTADSLSFLRQRLERLHDVGVIFMHFGDGSLTFNSPGEPMLDPVTACLATVGLLLMLRRFLTGYNAFLLFMAGTLLLVGTVFVQNLDVRRLQGLTVFIAIAASTAISSLLDVVRRGSRPSRVIFLGSGVAAGIFVAGFSYHLYFNRMAGDPEIRRAFKDYYTTLIRFGQQEAKGRPIELASIMHRFFDRNYHYRYNYSWLIDPSLTGATIGDLSDLLEPRSAATEVVVIQRPFETEAAARLLQTAYPGTPCHDFIENDNPWVGLKWCELPQERNPRPVSMGLTARYWTNEEGKDAPALSRPEPFLGYVMVPQICYTPGTGFCQAEWSGELEVPSGSEYRLFAETIGRTTFDLRLDGRAVDRFPYLLSPGRHGLQIRARLPRDWESGLRLSWNHDGIDEVVPFYSTD